MSEGVSKVPIDLIKAFNSTWNDKKLGEDVSTVDRAVQLAKDNFNRNLCSSNKQDRLETLIGDNLAVDSPNYKPEMSLYGKIFNNPDEKDREQRLKRFKKELIYPSFLVNPNGENRNHYKEQQDSIDIWLNYLSSPDNPHYPTWFKYYVITSVTKLVNIIDSDECKFQSRDPDTTVLFPKLIPGALAATYEAIVEHYIDKEKKGSDDFKRMLGEASFSKIYAYCVRKSETEAKNNKESREKTEGEWVEFKQGTDPNILYESLQGHTTGWCIANSKTLVSDYLKKGTFHIYYSKDENNKNTIPRITIRMEGTNQIAEIRGVNPNQDIEVAMLDITKEKNSQLPGGDKELFEKKYNNVKNLDVVDRKTNRKQKLTNDEIVFLYEIESRIETFGQFRDTRIGEIINERDIELDFEFLTTEEQKKKMAASLVSNLNDLSGQNLDRALDIIGKEADTKVVELLIYHIYGLSGENLEKVLDIMKKKLGNQIFNKLAMNLTTLDTDGENLGKILDFIGKADFTISISSSLVSSLRYLSGENLDKAWKIIEEKGGDDTASSLVLELADLSGENLDKAWKIIEEKGGDMTCSFLISELRDLPGENLDRIINFINRNGNLLEKRRLRKILKKIKK
jgi:hypothetical protein